jgi:hypothetical protein
MGSKIKRVLTIGASLLFGILSITFFLHQGPELTDHRRLLAGELKKYTIQQGLNSGVITVFNSSDLLLEKLINTPKEKNDSKFNFLVNESYGRWIQFRGMEAKALAHQSKKSLANLKRVFIISLYLENRILVRDVSNDTYNSKLPVFESSEEKKKALKLKKSRSKSRVWAINDDYFKAHVERIITSLEQLKIEPFIIISDLNRFFHKNKRTLNNTIRSLGKNIKKRGIGLLNLWSYNPMEPEYGILSDLFNFGDYGWLRVNEKIVEYFGEMKQ